MRDICCCAAFHVAAAWEWNRRAEGDDRVAVGRTTHVAIAPWRRVCTRATVECNASAGAPCGLQHMTTSEYVVPSCVLRRFPNARRTRLVSSALRRARSAALRPQLQSRRHRA